MDEPLIITKAYDLILYLVPQIEKFPRQQRYTLGERLASMTLDFLSLLIDARYARDKAEHLPQFPPSELLFADFLAGSSNEASPQTDATCRLEPIAANFHGMKRYRVVDKKYQLLVAFS